jgi:gamma-glutamyltranspeptidase/glutathione hydrolase
MSFGLMGGTMQAQGHTQLMVRMADYGQHPQSAIDGPRFRVITGLDVNIEREFPAATLAALASRGHNLVKLPEGYMDFGCSQIALKIDGGYVCASDARRDSLAVGF